MVSFYHQRTSIHTPGAPHSCAASIEINKKPHRSAALQNDKGLANGFGLFQGYAQINLPERSDSTTIHYSPLSIHCPMTDCLLYPFPKQNRRDSFESRLPLKIYFCPHHQENPTSMSRKYTYSSNKDPTPEGPVLEQS